MTARPSPGRCSRQRGGRVGRVPPAGERPGRAVLLRAVRLDPGGRTRRPAALERGAARRWFLAQQYRTREMAYAASFPEARGLGWWKPGDPSRAVVGGERIDRGGGDRHPRCCPSTVARGWPRSSIRKGSGRRRPAGFAPGVAARGAVQSLLGGSTGELGFELAEESGPYQRMVRSARAHSPDLAREGRDPSARPVPDSGWAARHRPRVGGPSSSLRCSSSRASAHLWWIGEPGGGAARPEGVLRAGCTRHSVWKDQAGPVTLVLRSVEDLVKLPTAMKPSPSSSSGPTPPRWARTGFPAGGPCRPREPITLFLGPHHGSGRRGIPRLPGDREPPPAYAAGP